MPAVKITQKPIGIPGDDTHFLVTQPELPEGYTPTGQETEEELAELKVESVREIEMDDMVELIQDKLDMDVTPTTGSSKPVTSGGIKAALDLMDEDISSLNEDITNLDEQINGSYTLIPEVQNESNFVYFPGYIMVSTKKWSVIEGRFYTRNIGLDHVSKISITANNSFEAHVAFLTDDTCENGGNPSFAIGTDLIIVPAGETVELDVPSDAIIFNVKKVHPDGYNTFPSSVIFYKKRHESGMVLDISNLKSAVSSAQTNITNINDEISSINDDLDSTKNLFTLDETTFSVVTGKVVSSSGIVSDRSDGFYIQLDVSPYLGKVKGLTRLNPTVGGYAFYDANGVFLSGGTNDTSSYEWSFEIKIPEDACIFRVSGAPNTWTLNAYAYGTDLSGRVAQITKKIFKSKSDIEILNDYVFIDNKVVSSLGTISDRNDAYYAELQIDGAGKVYGRTRLNPDAGGYAFYDAYGVLISGGTNPTGSYEWDFELDIPQKAKLFRIAGGPISYEANFELYAEVSKNDSEEKNIYGPINRSVVDPDTGVAPYNMTFSLRSTYRNYKYKPTFPVYEHNYAEEPVTAQAPRLSITNHSMTISRSKDGIVMTNVSNIQQSGVVPLPFVLPVPNALFDVEISSGEATVGIGLYKDSGNYVYCTGDSIVTGVSGTESSTQGSASVDRSSSYKIHFMLGNDYGYGLFDDTAGLKEGAVADCSALGLTTISALKTFCGALFVTIGANSSVTIKMVDCGMFEGIGHADVRLVTYEDGSPVLYNGKYYVTTSARFSMINGANGGICVYSIDNKCRIIKPEGMIFCRKDTVCEGSTSAKVLYDRDQLRWVMLTRAFPSSPYGKLHIGTTKENLLKEGIHIVDMYTDRSIADGSLDADLLKVNGIWHIAYHGGSERKLIISTSINLVEWVELGRYTTGEGISFAKANGQLYILDAAGSGNMGVYLFSDPGTRAGYITPIPSPAISHKTGGQPWGFLLPVWDGVKTRFFLMCFSRDSYIDSSIYSGTDDFTYGELWTYEANETEDLPEFYGGNSIDLGF